jgi:hypothetical protein
VDARNSSHNGIDRTTRDQGIGALVIDHKLSNVGDTADRTKCLIQTVEKGL